jgi:hypothetical protein
MNHLLAHSRYNSQEEEGASTRESRTLGTVLGSALCAVVDTLRSMLRSYGATRWFLVLMF